MNMNLLRSLAFLFFFYNCASVLGQEIRYDSAGKADPFIPLVSEDGIVAAPKFDPSDIHIEGIIFDPNGGSMVLINGEFYKEGDSVAGANLISIFRDRVIMSKADEEKTLWIREEIVTSGEGDNA